jgi:hypothetical protein
MYCRGHIHFAYPFKRNTLNGRQLLVLSANATCLLARNRTALSHSMRIRDIWSPNCLTSHGACSKEMPALVTIVFEEETMKQVLITGLLIILIATFGASAYAGSIPVLTLSDGVHTVIIQDGGIGDSDLKSGAITYIGAVGSNWTMNVTTGTTKPVLGTAENGKMDLTSIDATSTGAGTLTIRFFDDFFGPYTPASVKATVGGTLAKGGSVTYNTYFDASNTQALSYQMTGQTFSTSGSFSGVELGTLGPDLLDSTYSLTQQVIFTHTKKGITSLDAALAVPEPGGMLLLFVGIGFFASIAGVLSKN